MKTISSFQPEDRVKNYKLRIVVYVGYNDAGEPAPAKVIEDSFSDLSDHRATEAMLAKIKDLKRKNQGVPDYNIMARLTDESGQPVYVFEDF